MSELILDIIVGALLVGYLFVTVFSGGWAIWHAICRRSWNGSWNV